MSNENYVYLKSNQDFLDHEITMREGLFNVGNLEQTLEEKNDQIRKLENQLRDRSTSRSRKIKQRKSVDAFSKTKSFKVKNYQNTNAYSIELYPGDFAGAVDAQQAHTTDQPTKQNIARDNTYEQAALKSQSENEFTQRSIASKYGYQPK